MVDGIGPYPDHWVSMRNAHSSFAMDRQGRWALTGLVASDVWRSTKAVSGIVGGSVRATSDGSLEWRTAPTAGSPSVRYTARLLAARAGIRVNWRAEPMHSDALVRFPDEACSATAAEGGALVVPNRLGLLVSADGPGPATTCYPTYGGYGGLSMAMVGVLKAGSALLLWWDGPSTTLETRRRRPDPAASAEHGVVDLSLAHRGARGSVTLEPIGRGDASTVARAYRRVARERGFLVTLAAKSGGKDRTAGRPTFRFLGLQSFAPGTPPYHAAEHRKVVEYSFAEVAATVERLKRDVGVARATCVLSGWNRAGYDNQHPDVWPANPECGGNAGLMECRRRIGALGYLFGLHDNYQDIYRDSPSWDERVVARGPDGAVKAGGVWWGGQAYFLNTQAAYHLARRPANLPMAERLLSPDLCYLDTMGASPLQEDFALDRRMGTADDLRWKRATARYARRTFGMFGTEEGMEWAVPEATTFESMLFQRTQRQSAETLLPLFEMVYGDCVNILQGDRTTTRTPDYVLDNLICAEIPQCVVGRGATTQAVARIVQARRVSPTELEFSCEWRTGDRPPEGLPTAFWHFVPSATCDWAREGAAFGSEYVPHPPDDKWAPNATFRDGPHRCVLPAGLQGEFEALAGLHRQGVRLPLTGIDTGNFRIMSSRIRLVGDRAEVAAPEPTPDLCFARVDGRPDISHTADGLILTTYRILGAVNRHTAASPMTGHRFLTADHCVEQSQFGDVTITVNYGEKPYDTGRALLPRWGFLAESPRMAAFRADRLDGRTFSQTTLAVCESANGRPLLASHKLDVYRAYGDSVVLVGGRSIELPDTCSPPVRF